MPVKGEKRGRYDKRRLPVVPAVMGSIIDGDREAKIHARVADLSAAHLAAVQALMAKAHTDSLCGGVPRERDWSAVVGTCLHLAQLETHLEVMLAVEARGQLVSEEVRSVPSVSREIRAVRAELGLPGVVDAKGKVFCDDEV